MGAGDVHYERNTEAAKQHIREKAVQFLTAAAIVVTTKAKRMLTVPGTGRKRGKKAGPVTHAPKGQPPYKQTGRLRASITYEVDEQQLVARVGTNVEYARPLELLDHPFLRRSLDETRPEVDSIVARIGES